MPSWLETPYLKTSATRFGYCDSLSTKPFISEFDLLLCFVKIYLSYNDKTKTKLHGLYSASELYRPSDRRLSAKLVSTFADRGCRVVSVTDPPVVNSVFLTGAATFSFK
jgi:hypothetical protein